MISKPTKNLFLYVINYLFHTNVSAICTCMNKTRFRFTGVSAKQSHLCMADVFVWDALYRVKMINFICLGKSNHRGSEFNMHFQNWLCSYTHISDIKRQCPPHPTQNRQLRQDLTFSLWLTWQPNNPTEIFPSQICKQRRNHLITLNLVNCIFQDNPTPLTNVK